MAVLGRLLIAGAERVDLSDLLSIDSYVAGDFKFLLKGLVGDNTPYILRGFDVINPGDAIGSQSISIRVADSIVMYPGSTAGPFFHGLPEGNSFAQPVVPELRKNATNYVYLTFSTFETSNDTRAFWDPDLDGGVGGEFTQDINTESVLKVEVNVSTSSFPDNTIPVCKVVVGPAVITSIQDARDLMFRLGSGGLSPNPFNRFNFPSDPNSSYKRAEPPTTMSSALDPNPFQGADKNIKTLKEWMDVVMTKLAELGGTTFWYEDASTLNLINIFLDALGTTHTSKGQWSHSSSTAGQLTWTEDIQLKNIPDNRDVIIRSGSKTLLDQEVMYIPLVRDAEFNGGNEPVNWFNGLNFVNGTVGAFANLVKGDWVKKKGDPNSYNVRVEEFYANTNLTGGVTTAALARSIKLSANYSGGTELKLGARTQGVYTSAEVLVADRADGTLEALGGDLHWLAIRSDTIMAVSNITTSTITGDISDGDGSKAKFESVGHGRVDGEYITISGSTNYDGTYKIEVEDADTFYIPTAVTIDESGVDAYIALATTTTRSTADGLQLESANHGFHDDETIIIAGTSSGYDGSRLIKVRSATTFSFAIGSALTPVSTGTATLARINIRSDLGLDELLQGQSIGIGSPDSDNIMSYIGMGSVSQTHPTYNIPLTYNTLEGTSNYNGETDDNLTVRVAKLTAMMADKAQDKTIKILPSGYESITNTTSGLNQLITFQANTTPPQKLDIVLPSSDNNGTVGLTGTLTLAANQLAYIEIDRNAAFSYANLSALSVANIDDVVVDENIYVIALRLSGTDVWLWDGFPVSVGGPVFTPIERANRSLSNLIPTAINQDLVPDSFDITDNRKLGSATLPWSLTRTMRVSAENVIYSVTGDFSIGSDQITNVVGTLPAYNADFSYAVVSPNFESGTSFITTFVSPTVLQLTDPSTATQVGQQFYIVPVLEVWTDTQSASDPSSPVIVLSGFTEDGNSGLAAFGSGNVAGTGDSGEVNSYSGDSEDGDSGDNFIGTGLAPNGVRGQLWLDAPTINAQGNFLPDNDILRVIGTNTRRFLDMWSQTMGANLNIAIRDNANNNQGIAMTFAPSASGVVNIFQVRGPVPNANWTQFGGGLANGFGIIGRNDGAATASKTYDLLIETGNKTAGTGNSGDIKLRTGTSAGGSRGVVQLDGLSIDVTNKNVINVATPTVTHHASNKAYTDAHGGAQSIVSSGGVTVLTATSPRFTVVTGSTTHTIRLPSTAGLQVGEIFGVHNTNTPTGTVTVQDSASTNLIDIDPEGVALFRVLSTGVELWDITSSQPGGATLEITVTCGENLPINTPVYISEGVGDGGRTAGRAYTLDNADDNRINFVGFTKTAGTTGNQIKVKSSGTIIGLAGFTPGLPIYWVAGAFTQTVPTTANTYQIHVGTALSTTSLIINPDQASSAIFITESSGTDVIANNQVVDAAITNFIIDGSVYRSFAAEYWVYRTTASNEVAESGEIRGVYSTVAGTWQLSVGGIAGSAGVVFAITAGGQVTYTSDNLAGASYVGNIKFAIRNQLRV